ncbi:MAG: FAD-binding protein, partial [Deltaproteobacteria bacterium]|nr:FAD-binding protein [Deltaproteobacteria bacterium]
MSQREIWTYGDLRTVRHWQASLKVLAKAIDLAGAAGARTGMVLMGDGAESAESPQTYLGACIPLAEAADQAAALGAHTVHCLEHPLLAVPRTDLYARVLADFVLQRTPWLVLLPLNDFGREAAAIGAQRCQAGLIADSTELVLDQGRFVGRCPAWGGQIIADITLADGWPTAFVTVQPHGAKVPARRSGHGRIERIVLDRIEMAAGAELVRRSVQTVEARRLEDAETVVVGGAGLGDMRGFGLVRTLAAALGGEVGATRPAVMNHWVEEDRLIGQTGKSVRPKLLISVGTSGAIQYTAGIMEAETIVAINRDPAAPIFQLADIGIVADANTLLPLLNQGAQQAALRRLADATCAIGAKEEGPKAGFGAVVRQLRLARNWSPEELADATGQTPEFIAQVENDQLSPPVSFILRMAQAMKIDPSTFLHKEERAAIRDRRSQAYYQRTQSYSYATLTPEAANSHLRAFMITIEAHHDHKPVAYKHEGEEFIYVMEGDLGFTLGSREHVLKPGESIHFNSDVPHKLKSLSARPTRCLVVLY